MTKSDEQAAYYAI